MMLNRRLNGPAGTWFNPSIGWKMNSERASRVVDTRIEATRNDFTATREPNKTQTREEKGIQRIWHYQIDVPRVYSLWTEVTVQRLGRWSLWMWGDETGTSSTTRSVIEDMLLATRRGDNSGLKSGPGDAVSCEVQATQKSILSFSQHSRGVTGERRTWRCR